jgi:gamma-butyrobetaine dioxygenase
MSQVSTVLTPPRAEIVGEIIRLFRERGERMYGEDVTQTQHALQTAAAARHDHAPDHLVVAALLHDVGHVISELPEDAAEHDIDDVHEMRGADWLASYFPAKVVEPIRLHVAAKRYLCVAEPGYFDNLSQASRLSLAVQGGPMSVEEAKAFESHPHFADGVQLRRYDEQGKNPDAKADSVESFRALMQAWTLA